MKQFTKRPVLTGLISNPTQSGNARLTVLVLVALLVGVTGGALLVYQLTKKPKPVIAPGSIQLSDGTKSVLAHLRSPVEIQFVALFNPDSVSDNVRVMAANAGELLAEVERQSAGKVRLVHTTNWSVAAANAAAAAGLVPFNIEKGDAIYIGLLLKQENRRQILPQVLPEWAPALEFDLARALEKLALVETAATPAADVARTTAAEQAVKQAIPDPSAVSLDEGRKLLQELALRAFHAAAQEMNKMTIDAEKRVTRAEATKSETERQAALVQLQEVRAQSGERLREIALQAQAQQEAWSRLKSR